MKTELEKKIFDIAPNLFADKDEDMMVTCMCWGLECGDGWFDLLYEAAQKLEAEILKQPKEFQSHCKASQVKEKYATLRFYMTSETDEMSKIINDTENKSKVTCEQCGQPGICRGKGWYYIACNDCEKKR